MPTNISRMDTAMLRCFLLGGCNRLGMDREEVNALNVFPVPDGDTGINMYLTVSSAGKKILNAPDSYGVGRLAADFSQGSLMGARGNSGVILSQIFRGLAVALSEKKTITAKELAAALQKGVDLSYKSVMKPVEGTIITVYRLFAQAAMVAAQKDASIDNMLLNALDAGADALANTPNQLPVLKEAGVVDAGGKGLLSFFTGATEALMADDYASVTLIDINGNAATAESPVAAAARNDIATADIEFTYCTQLLIKGENLTIDKIRQRLSVSPPGDSLLVVGDEKVIKIHFHNNHPGQVLEYCAQFGSLHDIVIDNMRDQHNENMSAAEQAVAQLSSTSEPVPQQTAQPQSTCAVIAVCAGDGLAQAFMDMGAQVIQGGQTMNPSAEDILKAVELCPAEEVVILPNNSNIILTAAQVKKLSDKPVEVVPSKYVTQGITAILAFNPERSAAENAQAMTESSENVINGELTYAVRDTKFNGFDIKEGDLLELMQGDIVGCGQDLKQSLLDLLDKMYADSEDAELISLYYGNDLTEKEAEGFVTAIKERFSDFDVELYYGGQPLYYFLLAIE